MADDASAYSLSQARDYMQAAHDTQTTSGDTSAIVGALNAVYLGQVALIEEIKALRAELRSRAAEPEA